MPGVLDRVKQTLGFDLEDNDRLAKRREIQAQLAELEKVAGLSKGIAEQLRTVDAREDRAVAEHEVTCRPIQARLAEIDNEIGAAILADNPTPDKLAKERAKLLEQLLDANAKLEATTAATKRLRRELQKARSAMQNRLDGMAKLRSELASQTLGNPKLLLQRHVATQRVIWSEKRLADAEKELRSAEDAVAVQKREDKEYVLGSDTHQHLKRLEREKDRWQAELAAAQRERQAAIAERDRVREAIINE